MVADVLALDDSAAGRVDVAGGKAAALSAAARAGLPVLPGFVLTTGFTAQISDGADLFTVCEQARPAWSKLSAEGEYPLVVRASSPQDLASSLTSGRFTSQLDVRGWVDFVASVRAVLHSRAAATGGPGFSEPIAVLVQPAVAPAVGGVLFGVDPVSGRADRRVVAAVHGLPDRLVSGEVDGTRYLLTADGRPVRGPAGEDLLAPADLRALAALAAEVADCFAGPQEIEWALDERGALRLLQTRPVTVEVRGVPSGPVLGPAPVADTFPEPLAPLEADLWVPPLRAALREVLAISGAYDPAELDRPPVVVVDGQVALDLDLLAEPSRTPSFWSHLDPRPQWRRTLAAWRVGRLRIALPPVAAGLLSAADTELAHVPELGALTDRQLLALLSRAGQALRSLHAHEMLVGQIVRPDAARLTGLSVALRLLARARADGLSDADAALRYPAVLALTPPRIAAQARLPGTPAELPPWEPPRGAEAGALLWEALRLRARWMQEVSGRAAWALGERLVAAGRLPEPARIRRLRFAEVAAVARGGAVPTDLPPPAPQPEPLPARFRLPDLGRPIPLEDGAGGSIGAGGGRGAGPVHVRCETPPPPGSVLVTATLDPLLAPLLPRLAGLVTETGSVLAHLAILAREAGVPTVVGETGAMQRYRCGERVSVDGDTGEVHRDEDR